MTPLSFSENSTNDEQLMSFLPPPREVRIPKTSHADNRGQKIRGNRRHDSGDKYAKRERFCLPWMVESIAFMMLIAGAFFLKVLYVRLIENLEGEEVVKWKNLSNLRLDNIQHWCLNENVMTCSCASPLTPKSRYGHKTWTEAHLQNIEDAARRRHYSMDVVFLGDSIMEGWKGTSFGQAVGHKKDNLKVFESMFDSDKGGDVDGLVLGIAGDKSPNLLWRVQNGELPESLEAKVFWILIGTNDFLKDGLEHCSAEVVAMGVKRVVEEVRILKPNATIVINQILPRAPGTHNGLLYEDEETRNVTNAIKKVNHELKVFCNQHAKIDCFDASDIFIKQNETFGNGSEGEYIPNDLMRDHLHPTTEGYSQWGQKIVEKLYNITQNNVHQV